MSDKPHKQSSADSSRSRMYAVDLKSHNAVELLPAQPGMQVRATNISKRNTASNIGVKLFENGRYTSLWIVDAYVPHYYVS
jgi:hypothetical protein